jgi:uncharacterized Zn finger protein (UPF0148 family)
MKSSQWQCPTCKTKLYLTHSGRYWCTTCQAEQSTSAVDPCNRDFARQNAELEMRLEQTMGISFEVHE